MFSLFQFCEVAWQISAKPLHIQATLFLTIRQQLYRFLGYFRGSFLLWAFRKYPFLGGRLCRLFWGCGYCGYRKRVFVDKLQEFLFPRKVNGQIDVWEVFQKLPHIR